MDSRTGKIYDSKQLEEMAKADEYDMQAISSHMVPLTEEQVKELKEKTLQGRLGWLEEFKLKNELAKKKE